MGDALVVYPTGLSEEMKAAAEYWIKKNYGAVQECVGCTDRLSLPTRKNPVKMVTIHAYNLLDIFLGRNNTLR